MLSTSAAKKSYFGVFWDMAAAASAPPVVMGAAAQRKVAGAALALGHACAQWQVPLLAPGQP